MLSVMDGASTFILGSEDPDLNKAEKDLVLVKLMFYLKETDKEETNIKILQTVINVLKRITQVNGLVYNHTG